jgi:hypothetical protein
MQQVNFNSTYAIVIVGLLLLVCFCKQFLQALAMYAKLHLIKNTKAIHILKAIK